MTYLLAFATGVFLAAVIPYNGGLLIAGLVGLTFIVFRLIQKELVMIVDRPRECA